MRESKYQLLSLLLVICLAAGATFLTKAYATEASDIDTLFAASGGIISGDRSVTLIHRQKLGAYHNDEHMQKLGESWSLALQLPMSYVHQSNEAPVYETTEEASSQGSSSSLRITVLPDRSLYLIIRIQAYGSQDQVTETINSLRSKFEAALTAFDQAPNWNIVIQSTLATNAASLTSGSLQQYIGSTFQARLVEQYVDSRTASFTFYTDSLKQFLYSGSQQVNLQVNIHHDTTKGQPTITMGSPLITTDTQLP
jgi:hypothetical protein